LYEEKEENGKLRKYGRLSGIKIEEDNEVKKVVKRITSPELWE